jgi:chromosomal replication initiator protein
MIRVADIQRAVAKRYHIPVAQMCAPGYRGGRQRRYAWPRQVAIVLATRLTDHSYSRIGQFFGGRDHSTIIYACEAVEKRRKKNAKLHNSLRSLTLQIIQQSQAPLFHRSEISRLASQSCEGE